MRPDISVHRTTELRLAGQVAVITGGASGMGRATALALAAEGAAVTVVDVDAERVRETQEEVARRHPQGGCAQPPLGLVLDVRNEAHMEEMVAETIQRFGRLDALIASAGILRPRGTGLKLLVEMTVSEWDEMIDTNLKGVFLSNQKALAAMIPQRKGAIINISSVSGREGQAYDSAYCASKFAVIGLTESLAEEVRQYNIRVTALLPHAVKTPMWAQNGPVPAPAYALPPERVADLIVYILTLPDDTILLNPVIAPFRSRRRKAAQ